MKIIQNTLKLYNDFLYIKLFIIIYINLKLNLYRRIINTFYN